MRALVDGNNVAVTAFSVSGQLRNSKGVYTGTVLTFMDMMRTMLRAVPDIHQVIVAWDSSPTWRHKIFPEYKANRSHSQSRQDNDWTSQKTTVQIALRFFGMAQVGIEEMEADDIAGSWAGQDKEPICFVSNDRDWLQLLGLGRTDHKIYRTLKKDIVTLDSFLQDEDLSCGARNVQEYIAMKAIVGDPGDNIPGVQGVGPKKAMKYLHGNMKAGMDHQKIEAWMKSEEGYIRSLALYQLGQTPIKEGTVTTVDPDYNEPELIRMLTDWEAKSKLNDLDRFLQPFRDLAVRGAQNG